MKKTCIILLVLLLFNCNKKLDDKIISESSTSLNFDGIDDQLIVPNFEKLKINSGTIETWFKCSEKNGKEWQSIIAKTLAYQLCLYIDKPASYSWGNKITNQVKDTIEPNKWYHLALTFKNEVEKGSQVYLNGKPVGDPFKVVVLGQTSDLFIGGNSYEQHYFKGNIDEVRIWETVRTPQEILYNYNTEIDPTSKGLILYYKFNDATAVGDNKKKVFVKDETFNDFDGALSRFSLEGKTSNYVNDSPLKPKNFFSFKSFLLKYKWLLLSILFTSITVLIIVRLRTKLLVKENKKLENLVDKRTSDLNYSIKQKEILIQEIHHRVKNNLQFIISLIDFEITKYANNPTTKIALQHTSRRLLAMALVHEMLYKDDDVERISAKQYITELVTTIRSFSDINAIEIAYEIDVNDLFLSVSQSTSIGIITSEIITNCIKHAFDEVEKPLIKISLTINETLTEAKYTIADNGVGMNFLDDEQSGGIGKKLIDVFCRQLKGNYHYINDGGVVFKLSFPINN